MHNNLFGYQIAIWIETASKSYDRKKCSQIHWCAKSSVQWLIGEQNSINFNYTHNSNINYILFGEISEINFYYACWLIREQGSGVSPSGVVTSARFELKSLMQNSSELLPPSGWFHTIFRVDFIHESKYHYKEYESKYHYKEWACMLR